MPTCSKIDKRKPISHQCPSLLHPINLIKLRWKRASGLSPRLGFKSLIGRGCSRFLYLFYNLTSAIHLVAGVPVDNEVLRTCGNIINFEYLPAQSFADAHIGVESHAYMCIYSRR